MAKGKDGRAAKGKEKAGQKNKIESDETRSNHATKGGGRVKEKKVNVMLSHSIRHLCLCTCGPDLSMALRFFAGREDQGLQGVLGLWSGRLGG